MYAEEKVNNVWTLIGEMCFPHDSTLYWMLFCWHKENQFTGPLRQGIPSGASKKVQVERDERFVNTHRKPYKKTYSYMFVIELKMIIADLLLQQDSTKLQPCQKHARNILEAFPDTIDENHRIIYYMTEVG
jgi:hypothetical protein